ncbi:MAG: hypothetical protein A2908_04115 [Candidatus Staskawiczbacteria bacterium RIFCSPLOWO2_01_FULL_38_12b]|uniref:Uncharacterized protein n=1 Tax=Candidatus Staskawiczbacteria bacterium RIFCSPLOWO2_01_FULL_38_12b TaxID=1802214 RepID=A0A1G2IG77_9BACT|nr:MAG: hypothetical protein A2908_04115 [Candidatus Staskawiczbacteria bacterium RIFCSPLOWO2_01_FULL_38_12b]
MSTGKRRKKVKPKEFFELPQYLQEAIRAAEKKVKGLQKNECPDTEDQRVYEDIMDDFKEEREN